MSLTIGLSTSIGCKNTEKVPNKGCKNPEKVLKERSEKNTSGGVFPP